MTFLSICNTIVNCDLPATLQYIAVKEVKSLFITALFIIVHNCNVFLNDLENCNRLEKSISSQKNMLCW